MHSYIHEFVLKLKFTNPRPNVKNNRAALKDLLTHETAAASSCDTFLSFFLTLCGFYCQWAALSNPPTPPVPIRRAPGVFEASAPPFVVTLFDLGL